MGAFVGLDILKTPLLISHCVQFGSLTAPMRGSACLTCHGWTPYFGFFVMPFAGEVARGPALAILFSGQPRFWSNRINRTAGIPSCVVNALLE